MSSEKASSVIAVLAPKVVQMIDGVRGRKARYMETANQVNQVFVCRVGDLANQKSGGRGLLKKLEVDNQNACYLIVC